MHDRPTAVRGLATTCARAAAVFVVVLGSRTVPMIAQSDAQRVATVLAQSYVDSAFHPAINAVSVDAILAALNDPSTRHLTAPQFAAFQREIGGGAYTGVGLAELLGVDVDSSGRGMVVISPDPGSSAANHGLRAGDRIIAIDKAPTDRLSLSSACELLRGPIGSSVRLSLRRGTRQFDVTLTRKRIAGRGAMVDARTIDAKPRIGYVRLRGFTATTADSVAQVLAEFARSDVSRIVVDLRGNPGGDLAAARRVAGMFVGPKPIALISSRGRADTLRATAQAVVTRPVTVLTSAGTASAAELLAVALRDAGGATVLGEHTFGKGLVHLLIGPLSDGSAVIFTSSRLQTLGGVDILTAGVEPSRHCKVKVQPIPICS